MATHLPSPKQVRDLLLDLLGRDVELGPAAPFAPAHNTPASFAVYVDDSLMIRALVAADLPFSAYAGGAIGLVPAAGTEAAVEDGALTETLAENLYEVLNIAASLFNVPEADHLRLHELHPAGAQVPPAVRAASFTLGRREDLWIDIAGYGKGALSMVVIA